MHLLFLILIHFQQKHAVADELRIELTGLLRKAQMECDANFLKGGVRVV